MIAPCNLCCYSVYLYLKCHIHLIFLWLKSTESYGLRHVKQKFCESRVRLLSYEASKLQILANYVISLGRGPRSKKSQSNRESTS